MSNYTCEAEVSVDGIDVMVLGAIEPIVIGVDKDGDPITMGRVVIDNVFPAVTVRTISEPILDTYSEFPLSSIPISWKDALVQAILDQAEADSDR